MGKQAWKPDVPKSFATQNSDMIANFNSNTDLGKFRKPSPDEFKQIEKPILKPQKPHKEFPKEMIRPHQINKTPIFKKDSLSEVELPETDKELRRPETIK